ncbi:MAG TPA: hypothetical protein VIT92_03175 [Burkholderiaceae bacterium]
MHASRLFTAIALPLLVVCNAGAAQLNPDQQAALNKILATMPADQQAKARPHLEATLSRLNKHQLDMMTAGMAKREADKAAPKAAASQEGDEWGAAEADFAKAFALSQEYTARMSDVRDAAADKWRSVLKGIEDEQFQKRRNFTNADPAVVEACERELNLVPRQRRKFAAMLDTLSQQDRMTARQIVELRAQYGNVNQYAQTLGAPVSSPLVGAVRHFFAAPMAEADVKAKFQNIEREIAALAESHARAYLGIAGKGYSDMGAGKTSNLQEKDFEALRDKDSKAAAAICAQGLEAYQRGLVYFMAPVVAKAKPAIVR